MNPLLVVCALCVITPVASYADNHEERIAQLTNQMQNLSAYIEQYTNGLPYHLWEAASEMQGWQPPYDEYQEYQTLNQTIQDIITQWENDEIERLLLQELEAERLRQQQLEAEMEAEAERLRLLTIEQAEIDRLEKLDLLWNTTKKWSPHVTIILDESCIRMLQNDIPTVCPTYETLYLLDNSYHVFDKWYVDKYDMPRRQTIFDADPASYYTLLRMFDSTRVKTTMHIIVDPTDWETSNLPRIILTPNLPDYKHRIDLRWDPGIRNMTIFKHVHISDNCREALISADKWREVLHLVLHELRTKCISMVHDEITHEGVITWIDDEISRSHPVFTSLRTNGTVLQDITIHGQTISEYAYSYNHTAQRYEFPKYSEAWELVLYWQDMAQRCSTGWRVC